jgi:hypothetical protein
VKTLVLFMSVGLLRIAGKQRLYHPDIYINQLTFDRFFLHEFPYRSTRVAIRQSRPYIICMYEEKGGANKNGNIAYYIPIGE